MKGSRGEYSVSLKAGEQGINQRETSERIQVLVEEATSRAMMAMRELNDDTSKFLGELWLLFPMLTYIIGEVWVPKLIPG